MNDSLTNCDECPLGSKPSRTRVPFQMPRGQWNGLAIVGEQPAHNEAREGIPFVGNSGKLLNVLLGRAGIDRAQCFVTNAFQCYHPAAADMPDGDKAKCAQACRQRLVAELLRLSPKNTIALGGIALKSVTDNWSTKKDEEPGWTATITDLRGGVLRSSIGDLLAADIPGNVTASFHPAAILRSGGQEADILEYDIQKVGRWVREGGPQPWQDSFVLAPKPEELLVFLEMLAQQYGGAAVDIECVQGEGELRFNRWMDRIRMVGVGWGEHAMVVPMLEGEWQAYYTPEEFSAVVSVLRRFLGDKRLFSIFHNLQYDVPVLHRHQLPVKGPLHDTMAAHYCLYHMGVRHGLGYVAQQYLDVPPWKELHGSEHVETDVESEAAYNSRDVRTTAMIKDVILPIIEQEGLQATYAMTVRNYELAWQMGRDGIAVDDAVYRRELNRWAEKRMRDRISLLEEAGVGAVQAELLDLIESRLQLAELRRAKLSSFASGTLSLSDVVKLRDVLCEVKQRVVQKKAVRELNESEELLSRLLAQPGLELAASTLCTLSRVQERVKAKKKGKQDEQLDVTQEELEALPDSVRELFGQCVSSWAAERVDASRGFLDHMSEKKQLGEQLTVAQQSKLDKVLGYQIAAKFPLSDPNHLKLVKVSDWAEVFKEYKRPISKLAGKARTATKRLVRYVSRYPLVNFQANYEAGLVIHHWFGLPVQAPLTSRGEYAVDKEALRHIKGHPLVKVYQNSSLSHDRWDWLNTLPVYPDGRVHPYYKPVLKSGRWASGDSGSEAHPLETLNAQNIEEVMLIIFTARPGYKYVGADYSGLELRVGGVMTGCKNLLEQFHRYDAGLDLKVHAQTARRIWKDWEHLPIEDQKQYYQEGKRYKLAKSGGFLTFYGGGPGALAQKILEMEPYEPDPQKRAARESEIDEEAREFMRELKTVWPEVFDVREQWYHLAKRTGKLPIGMLTGRYLRFPLTDDDHVSPTLCANAPVQSTAGEIAHYGFDRLARALPYSCRVVLYIHDCLIVECPDYMAEDVAVLMKECMEYYIDGPAGGLLCSVDPKIGYSIAEVH